MSGATPACISIYDPERTTVPKFAQPTDLGTVPSSPGQLSTVTLCCPTEFDGLVPGT